MNRINGIESILGCPATDKSPCAVIEEYDSSGKDGTCQSVMRHKGDGEDDLQQCLRGKTDMLYFEPRPDSTETKDK